MVKFPFKFPELKPNEIRANILYCGLCASDVQFVKNLRKNAKYPVALGHEIIAEISMIGLEVKNLKKGDLIGFGTTRSTCDNCNFCNSGKENICKKRISTYGDYWGGYATAFQAKADWCFKLPENFDIKRGAPLFCAGITTYNPIITYLKNNNKKNTGVIGCGGLGHMAIQFLVKLGHNVIAYTTSPDKEKLLKELDVNKIIISTNKKQMKENEETIDFLINTLSVNSQMQK